ncbi:unnamed protein product [Amoebophrya sp. A25]|nr:unnamed protein product [Amoebophrya sp. A25]|eukprot:GSA25T00001918001.1
MSDSEPDSMEGASATKKRSSVRRTSSTAISSSLFSLNSEDPIFDCAWHPSRDSNLFATASITGCVDFWKLPLDGTSNDAASCVSRRKRHKGGVRGLAFAPGCGSQWVSVSSDQTALVSDTETNQRILRTAFESAVNVVRYLGEDGNVLLCGLDDGSLHFVDIRERTGATAKEDTETCAGSGGVQHRPKIDRRPTFFREQEDFISDLLLLPEKGHVCATSGDGTLGVYDWRRRKLFALSDPQDDELMSLGRCRQGSKIVCGAQEGDLKIFTLDDYGDCKDRIVLDIIADGSGRRNKGSNTGAALEIFGSHANAGAATVSTKKKGGSRRGDSTLAVERVSADSLCNVGDKDDYLLCGGSDGAIRLVAVHSQLHGNRVVAKLGYHGGGSRRGRSAIGHELSEGATNRGMNEDDDNNPDVDAEEDDEIAAPSAVMPIEVLAQSPWDADVVASCGHDGVVQFWNFGQVLKEITNPKAEMNVEAKKNAKKRKKTKNKIIDLATTQTAAVSKGNDFWGGL